MCMTEKIRIEDVTFEEPNLRLRLSRPIGFTHWDVLKSVWRPEHGRLRETGYKPAPRHPDRMILPADGVLIGLLRSRNDAELATAVRRALSEFKTCLEYAFANANEAARSPARRDQRKAVIQSAIDGWLGSEREDTEMENGN